MALEKELEYFEAIKADLLKNHEGKFALVKDDRLVGVFDSTENAYVEGVKLFGAESFLIKRIAKEEPTEHIPAFSLRLIDARIL